MRYLLIAMLSGFIYSLGTIISKILISEVSLTTIITNPLFLFVNLIFGGGGFILSQISIKMEKTSHVWLLSTATATLFIVLASFLVLNENVSISELIGVALMMLGSIILVVKRSK